MSRYLVTGIAGFIGSSIASALVARGDQVRGIDNFSTGKHANLATIRDRIELIEADVADLGAVRRACQGVEYVFHEAAVASVPKSVEDPVGCNDANVTGTLNVLVAAREAGIKRVVYAASSATYGDAPGLPKTEDMSPSPISPYAVSKLAGEYYLQSFTRVYGLETVCLRYFNIFGPRQDPTSQYSGVLARFTSQMLAGETPTILGDGETSRDFCYIDNVVQANLKACAAPADRVSGKVFNIATGTSINLKQAYAVLKQAIGYVGDVKFGPERVGDVKHSVADISRAVEAFGYQPAVSFQEGIKHTVAWYREQAAAAAHR